MKRGRKPVIATEIQMNLFRKYHEDLRKSNLKYNNPVFEMMSKEIDAKMSPKALYLAYKKHYDERKFSEPRTSEVTSFTSSKGTSISPQIVDKIKMALTSAERAKRYRDKLKNNPEKAEEVRKKQLARMRAKRKKVSEMNEEEKLRYRNKWIIEKRKQRADKSKTKVQIDETPNKESSVTSSLKNRRVLRRLNHQIQRWQNLKSIIKANYQKNGTGFNKVSELKGRLLKCSDIESVEMTDYNNIQIEEAEPTNDIQPSSTQQRLVFSFMKANKNLGRCQLKGPNAERRQKVLMKQLSLMLNKMGPAVKSSDDWLKYWQDWKSSVKAKLNKIKLFNQTRYLMQNYVRAPCALTLLEKKLVEFCSLDTVENGHEVEEQSQVDVSASEIDVSASQLDASASETSEPGPYRLSSETGLIIEDIIQPSSAIKMELESSDSDDPLNFAEPLISDPHSPELKPEPEVEQPASPATNTPRRKRVRRVLKRPIPRRQDTLSRLTINELRKALTEKNEIKKQFYTEYMVEVRKQTEALVTIAKKLTDR
ncbi:hypothetical protein PYW07_013088 [Mythimna separata]|uniref:Regulatory protein zeste n=1 Tax=Mythimna separata TaxID=271217 RepID=A0AAD8DJY1_MYTSE|nr:hypothetical protein PYW07_013088 [Mythimna separata]